MMPNAFGGEWYTRKIKGIRSGFGRLALCSTYQLNHENTDTKMCSWVAAQLHAAAHTELEH